MRINKHQTHHKSITVIMFASLSALTFHQGALAQLTVQPYAPNTNTAALFQFNENSGVTTLSDSTGKFTGTRALSAASSPFVGAPGPSGLGGAASITTNSQRPSLNISASETGYFNTQTFTFETWVRFSNDNTRTLFNIRDFNSPHSQVRFSVQDRTNTQGRQGCFSKTLAVATRPWTYGYRT